MEEVACVLVMEVQWHVCRRQGSCQHERMEIKIDNHKKLLIQINKY